MTKGFQPSFSKSELASDYKVNQQDVIDLLGRKDRYSEADRATIEQVKAFATEQNISFGQAIKLCQQARQQQQVNAPAASASDEHVYAPDFSGSSAVMESALTALTQQTVSDIQQVQQVAQLMQHQAAIALANVVMQSREGIAREAAEIVAARVPTETSPIAQVMLRVMSSFREQLSTAVPTLPAVPAQQPALPGR